MFSHKFIGLDSSEVGVIIAAAYGRESDPAKAAAARHDATLDVQTVEKPGAKALQAQILVVYTYINKHIRARARAHTRTHTHTRTHARTLTHTHTHTRTHTHAHTCHVVNQAN